MSNHKPKFRPLTDGEEARTQAGIRNDPDNPELTDEELARMRPAREVLPPEFFEAIDAMRRGRPALDAHKKQITLRLDQDVIEKFRSTGPGWQSRINEALKRART